MVQYLQDAAMKTVQDHKERKVQKIMVRFYAGTLWLTLPSGRSLAFLKPRIQPNRFGNMSLTYEGTGSTEGGGKWGRQETYGGKLTENCIQAIARDLLVDSLIRMEKANLCPVGHIHDEVILEVKQGEHSIDEVCGLMAKAPAWAAGLPLAAAGYDGASYYYKD